MKASITRIVTGVIIIAIGVGFLLDTLNIFEFSEIAKDWWPLAVIGVGALMFFNETSRSWAFFLTLLGVALQVRELGFTDINPWQLLWPLVIIFVGLSLLVRRGLHRKVSKAERDDLTAILGGTDQRSTADDFKGSKVTAVMGGVKLDLRKATIKKEATIEVFSFWGGIELIVPRDITVRNQTSAILGGVEDKTEQESGKNAPVLYITGDVIMAGVEIKN